MSRFPIPKAISEIDDPRLVKALAHPIRIAILRALEGGTASPSEIATRIEAPLPNVSYHVRLLTRAGLIELVETVPRRGAIEHYYRTAGPVRVTDGAWGQVPAIVKARLVDSALEQIGEQITQAAVTGGFERDDSVLARQSLTLDEEGFHAAAKAASDFLDRVQKIERESSNRLSSLSVEGRHATSATAVIMVFEAAAPVLASPDRTGGTQEDSSHKTRGTARRPLRVE